MISPQFNNIIYERDMDLLFLESVLTDNNFCSLLINKTDLKGQEFKVKSAELSKTDNVLGESDIEIVFEIEEQKYGFLIEDKIDAIPMPEQHTRYIRRGEKGVKNGEYNDFRIFIFCPEKYFTNNEDAKQYENLITYEECKKYFDSKPNAINEFRSKQLEQALKKAKKPASNNVNEKANMFLRQYIRYQKENYPSLDLSTKEDKNGWWTDYRTELGYVYINHKIQEGHVDLTFTKASDKFDRAKIIAEWARQHKIDATAVKAKSSSMIRIRVPKIDILNGFDCVDKEELNQCFNAIKELTDFANIIEIANSITIRQPY